MRVLYFFTQNPLKHGKFRVFITLAFFARCSSWCSGRPTHQLVIHERQNQIVNRERKSEIKSINALQLNEEQKEAKRLIIENQIVVITGRAGSGKSLVCAQAALDFLKKKQIECIYNTRAAIEVGKSIRIFTWRFK
jgi:phosphate starvation-inducible protein PhoH